MPTEKWRGYRKRLPVVCGGANGSEGGVSGRVGLELRKLSKKSSYRKWKPFSFFDKVSFRSLKTLLHSPGIENALPHPHSRVPHRLLHFNLSEPLPATFRLSLSVLLLFPYFFHPLIFRECPFSRHCNDLPNN